MLMKVTDDGGNNLVHWTTAIDR